MSNFDVRDLSLPDEIIAANTEIGMSIDEAEQLIKFLQKAVREVKADVNP